MVFDVKTASRLIGVPQATLRNWEQRYGVVIPARSEGGHRQYDLGQIVALKQIARLVEKGRRAGDIFEGLKNGQNLPRPVTPLVCDQLREKRTECYRHLIKYQALQAHLLIDQVHNIYSPSTLLSDFYPWILKEAGRDWEQKNISVAQEHFVTSVIHSRLHRLLSGFYSTDGKIKVLLATPSGELHEGGALLLTCALKIQGIEAFYAGASLPIDELQKLVAEIRPAVACLSYFVTQPHWQELIHFAKTHSTHLCLGGPGVDHYQGREALPKNIFVPERMNGEPEEAVKILAAA